MRHALIPRRLLVLPLWALLVLRAAAGDVVWRLTEDNRYLVQISEVDGRPAAYLRNATGTWSRTAPGFLEAMKRGLAVSLDGAPVKVVPLDGLAPAANGVAGGTKDVRVTLYGQELARIEQRNGVALTRSERTLSAFDVRSFSSDATYAERFKPIARYRADPRTALRTDLHTHLAGHLEFESLMRLAHEHDVRYPVSLLDKIGVRYPAGAVVDGKIPFRALTASPEFQASHGLAALEDAMTIEKSRVRTFLDMEEKYVFRGPISKDPALFKDMLWEVARTSQKSGVRYTEQSISNILDPDWLKIANAEIPKIEKQTGVTVRFVAGLWRHSDVEWNLDEITKLKRMVKSTPYIVGVDFMGHETNATSALESQIRSASEIRKLPGYEHFQVRVHGGENPLNPGNVREAAEYGATRVGHGLYIDKDAAAMRLDPYTQKIDAGALDALKRAGVVVELNPTSNHALNNLSGGADVLLTQFRQFKEAGVPVTIGSDGVGMYGADHREVHRMLRTLGFADDDFKYLRRSELDYVAKVEGETRRRAESVRRFGEPVPTHAELEKFVDDAGRHHSKALEAERQAAQKARVDAFHEEFARKGIVQYDPARFDGMKAFDLSGGSKGQFEALAREGRTADLKIPEIRAMLEKLLPGLDPAKVFFVTGGTQFGVEQLLHEEVARFNASAPDGKKFRIVGVLPLEANAHEVFGPAQAGITDYKIAGKSWADFSRHKLDLLAEHGGVKMAVAGKMFVADEFRHGLNARLPFQTLYFEGPVGAGTDLAKENPAYAVKNADDILAKMGGGGSSDMLKGAEGGTAKVLYAGGQFDLNCVRNALKGLMPR